MKIRTNSPTVLDLVIRLLTQNGVAVRKLSGNEIETMNDEGELRLLLQEKLDGEKFDFEDDFVLVDGNSVWSYDKIMREIGKIGKKNNTDGISGYFYKFMSLNFTIAHGNMRGWMVEYPSFEKVLGVLANKTVPKQMTDVTRILVDAKEKIITKNTKEDALD